MTHPTIHPDLPANPLAPGVETKVWVRPGSAGGVLLNVARAVGWRYLRPGWATIDLIDVSIANKPRARARVCVCVCVCVLYESQAISLSLFKDRIILSVARMHHVLETIHLPRVLNPRTCGAGEVTPSLPPPPPPPPFPSGVRGEGGGGTQKMSVQCRLLATFERLSFDALLGDQVNPSAIHLLSGCTRRT